MPCILAGHIWSQIYISLICQSFTLYFCSPLSDLEGTFETDTMCENVRGPCWFAQFGDATPGGLEQGSPVLLSVKRSKFTTCWVILNVSECCAGLRQSDNGLCQITPRACRGMTHGGGVLFFFCLFFSQIQMEAVNRCFQKAGPELKRGRGSLLKRGKGYMLL